VLKKILKKICLSNLWLWGYLMKVVTIFDFEGTWWRLLQSLILRVPDEGCCNLWLWGYLMKVVPIFDFEGLKVKDWNNLHQVPSRSKIGITFIRYPQSQRLEQPSSDHMSWRQTYNCISFINILWVSIVLSTPYLFLDTAARLKTCDQD
jgi:hypothetical protein